MVIYDIAIKDKQGKFTSIYAQLCTKAFLNHQFLIVILNKCQKGFSEKLDIPGDLDKSEEEEFVSKYKIDLHGNTRFICELYREKIIPNNIIKFCIQDLIDLKDCERISILFNSIGKYIDKTLPNLSDYMKEIENIILSSKDSLKSRDKFIIEDVLFLYKNNWKSISLASVKNNTNNEYIEPSKIKNIFEEYFENEELEDLEYNIEQDFGKNKYNIVFENALIIYSPFDDLKYIINLMLKLEDKLSISNIYSNIQTNLISIKKDHHKISNVIDKLSIYVKDKDSSQSKKIIVNKSISNPVISKQNTKSKSKFKSKKNYVLLMSNLPKKIHPMDIYKYFEGLGHLEVEIFKDKCQA